ITENGPGVARDSEVGRHAGHWAERPSRPGGPAPNEPERPPFVRQGSAPCGSRVRSAPSPRVDPPETRPAGPRPCIRQGRPYIGSRGRFPPRGVMPMAIDEVTRRGFGRAGLLVAVAAAVVTLSAARAEEGGWIELIDSDGFAAW